MFGIGRGADGIVTASLLARPPRLELSSVPSPESRESVSWESGSFLVEGDHDKARLRTRRHDHRPKFRATFVLGVKYRDVSIVRLERAHG